MRTATSKFNLRSIAEQRHTKLGQPSFASISPTIRQYNQYNPTPPHPVTMSTLLNLLNASIECNNLGVVLLNAGDLENALDSFMTAAKLMHPVSKQVNTIDQVIASHGVEHSFEIPEGIRRVVQASTVAAHGKLPSHNNIFIRSEPIQLETAQRLPVDCTLESAAVVYNMALSYHLQGTFVCKQRAVFLYDMAFNLSSAHAVTPTATTIAMASLNNAGQIFHSVGDYVTSRKYLDTLRYYIIKLPLPSDSQTMEERHEFLLNAVLLRPPTTASAA